MRMLHLKILQSQFKVFNQFCKQSALETTENKAQRLNDGRHENMAEINDLNLMQIYDVCIYIKTLILIQGFSQCIISLM